MRVLRKPEKPTAAGRGAALTDALKCPYAQDEGGSTYFCSYDGMEFESMPAHCGYCEMYEFIMKRGLEVLNESEKA